MGLISAGHPMRGAHNDSGPSPDLRVLQVVRRSENLAAQRPDALPSLVGPPTQDCVVARVGSLAGLWQTRVRGRELQRCPPPSLSGLAQRCLKRRPPLHGSRTRRPTHALGRPLPGPCVPALAQRQPPLQHSPRALTGDPEFWIDSPTDLPSLSSMLPSARRRVVLVTVPRD